jgi:hypothetical protein
MVPLARDLRTIRASLTIFGLASGLFSNLEKSVAAPLHCSEDDVARVHEILSCQIEELPCRYLGVPLSVRRLRRSDEQFLIDKVTAKIPKWKGNMLNVAGRTALTKATMSAIPIHMSIALCLSRWAVDSIDKLRRAFIWSGSETVGGGRCKVAWESVCRPRDLGGLGVSDLRRAGIALRVRWEWKARTERRLGLCSDERSVVAVFQAATIFSLGNGESTFFWTDRWIQGSSIQVLAPAVFAAVSTRKRRATVADALHQDAWIRHITGPLSMQVLMEFDRMCDILEEVQLTPQPDTFAWRLTADQNYSAASAYGAMFLGSSQPFGARQVWKTSAPPQVKFFWWLVLHGRCWTGDRRYRHGRQDSNTCTICDQTAETMDHILLECPFAREVWGRWLMKLHLSDMVTVQHGPAISWWIQFRMRIPKTVHRGFDSLFFLIGWLIWKERNARTFNGVATTPAQLESLIQDEIDNWCLAGYSQLRTLMAFAC